MRLRPRLKPGGSAVVAENPPLSSIRGTSVAGDDPAQDGSYSFETVTLNAAVDRCVAGTWDMPDFQRGFVWKPAQSAMLADSLWRNYPIGFLLLWTASHDTPGQNPCSWIADGQQRLTSLSLLFGKEPRWWTRRPGQEWDKVTEHYDIRFDIQGEGLSRFVVEHSAMDENRFIPMPKILSIDPTTAEGRIELQKIAAKVKLAGYAEALREEEVLAQLMRVASIRNKTLVVNSVTHQVGEVLEIFDRLNSRGIRFRWLVLRTIHQTLSAVLGGGRNRATRDLVSQQARPKPERPSQKKS
jgi:hypothetical protein